MLRLFLLAWVAAVASLLGGPVLAQTNAVSAKMYCYTLNNGLEDWVPCTSSTPLTVQPAGNSFVNVTTNTDTNVKGSAGTLVGFSVNTAGTNSTLTLYNDADGTCSSGLIGTFSTTAQSFVSVPVNATVGICATTAGDVAADVTIFYK